MQHPERGVGGIEWRWRHFAQLDGGEVYRILQARQEVFAVEQGINYQDCDGCDLEAWHLFCDDGGRVTAYLRALAPGAKYPDAAAFGRVLTAPERRRRGLGLALVAEALRRMGAQWPGCAISISSQSYLAQFYERFGFAAEGAAYMEEGIEHIKMTRPSS